MLSVAGWGRGRTSLLSFHAPYSRSRSLTRQEIVATALQLTHEKGLARLTMRGMAAELGVTPMALYYYIEGKDDLMRLEADEVSASYGPLRLEDDGWEASLGRHLTLVGEELARYPGLASYQIEQPTLGVTSEGMQAGVRFFEQAGFSASDARLAWTYALTYIHGRLSVAARLGRQPEASRLDCLHARDYVIFGVEAVIRGLQLMLATRSGADRLTHDAGTDSCQLPETPTSGVGYFA
jgi:TetR/AcrR family transcriptional regulator, tetracycline repressor protein